MIGVFFLISLTLGHQSDDELKKHLQEKFTYEFASIQGKHASDEALKKMKELDIERNNFLDVGSGPGFYIDTLGVYFKKIVSIEPDTDVHDLHLSKKEKKMSNYVVINELYENFVENYQAQFQKLGIKDGFDLIIMGQMLYYVFPKKHKNLLLDTFNKLLSDKGLLMVSMLKSESAIWKIYERANYGCLTNWVDYFEKWFKEIVPNNKLMVVHDDHHILKHEFNDMVEELKVWTRLHTWCGPTHGGNVISEIALDNAIKRGVREFCTVKQENGKEMAECLIENSHLLVWKAEYKKDL